VKPTLKKVSKYENKFAKLQKKAAEFNFRNQLKVVKKKEFQLEEEDKEVCRKAKEQRRPFCERQETNQLLSQVAPVFIRLVYATGAPEMSRRLPILYIAGAMAKFQISS
jgi:hypothetical protein